MSVFKFRVALEQDDTIFRDVELKATHTFQDFHEAVLKAFAFDDKHEASFFKSNDNWIKGEELALNKKENTKLMSKMPIAGFIDDPHQKIVYLYDYETEWEFLVELMVVTEEIKKTKYPQVVRTEGIAPKQYGNQPIAGVEGEEGFEAVEIYDEEDADGMGEEDENGEKIIGEDANEDTEMDEEELGGEEAADEY